MAEDVLERFISLDKTKEIYGLFIDSRTGVGDPTKTPQLRKWMKSNFKKN